MFAHVLRNAHAQGTRRAGATGGKRGCLKGKKLTISCGGCVVEDVDRARLARSRRRFFFGRHFSFGRHAT